MTGNQNIDKAGAKYWDEVWEKAVLPKTWDPKKPGLHSYVQKQFHEYFGQAFKLLKPTQGKKLLEIGCASSRTLPYFAKEFGFEVTGIDYSKVGCEVARVILEKEGIQGTILCEDFFAPSDSLIGQFDVVVSFGVVEHFEDTARCISAFSRFLKPSGIMITIIPNMVGIIGYIQKVINRPIFDIHVPIDKETFICAHKKSGLKVLDCNYFMSTNFGVCNLNGIPVRKPVWYIKKIILVMLIGLSIALWLLELKVGKFKSNKLMSPYIICLAQKE